jgi:hypothetical protein
MEHRSLTFNRSSSALRREFPQNIERVSEPDSPIVRGLNAAQRTAVTTPSKIVQILAPRNSPSISPGLVL